MALFGEAADRIVDDYSLQFEAAFLDLMRRTHPFSRVGAQVRGGSGGRGGLG
jgi:hypothetical protein